MPPPPLIHRSTVYRLHAILTHETPADRVHAADSTGKFCGPVGRHVVQLSVLEPEIRAWVIIGPRVRLALLAGERGQIGRILTPINVLDRIDALLGQRNG